METIDLNTPLSNKEIAVRLMDYCHQSLREERNYFHQSMREERNYFNELINDKVDTVIKGMTRGMSEGFAMQTDVISKQSDKIADLEMKLETLSNYNEQSLLHHMRNSTPYLQDTVSTWNCSVCIRNPYIDFGKNHSSHFHCSSCLDVFSSVKDLYRHECTPHTKFALNPCWSCGDTFTEEKLLAIHLQNVHGAPGTCNRIIGEESPSSTQSEHLLTSPNDRNQPTMSSCTTKSNPFPCNLCGETFVTIYDMISHRDGCTSETRLDCSTGQTSNLLGSYQYLSPELAYIHYCHHCNHLFQSEDDLTFHINQNHVLESGQDTRTICDFPSHMVSLHSSPGISCNTCGLSFYNKEGLCSHEQYQHTMPLLLHCNYCDQTFKEMRQLNINVKNNHTPPTAPPREEAPTVHEQLDDQLGNILDHIPQLDGGCDLDAADDMPLVTAQNTSVSNLVTKFSLNPRKQLAGLAKNAKLRDLILISMTMARML